MTVGSYLKMGGQIRSYRPVLCLAYGVSEKMGELQLPPPLTVVSIFIHSDCTDLDEKSDFTVRKGRRITLFLVLLFGTQVVS